MKRVVVLLSIVLTTLGVINQQSPILDTNGRAIDGTFGVNISLYTDASGDELFWVGRSGITLPDVRFKDGYLADTNILPEIAYSMAEFWMGIKSDDLNIPETRISFSNTEEHTLRRETPHDSAEGTDITEEMATHLQIGRVGETDDLVVHSPKVGFGVDTPNERIDIDGAIAMKEGTAPTATTAYGKVYVNDADGHLYFIDEAGNITDLTVDANAVQSVSSSANPTGRTEHMRFIPGSGTDITESATDDTIYISYNVNVSTTSIPPCSSAPSAPSTIEGASTVCTGEPGAAYAVPPVSDATFYTWTVPSDAVITDGIGSNSINVVFGSSDGNVCARAFNECGSSAQICQAVTINRPTSPGSITGTSPVCPGQTGVSYYIASVPGATNYIWTLPPGAVLASGTGTPNITVNFGTSGGDICVQTENSCGTSTPVCMPVVMTATPATPGAITGSSTVCEGTTGAVYSISSVAEATSYSWTLPSGASITAGSGTEAVTVTFGSTSGDVCVTASSICGTSSPRCLSVTVNLAPVVTTNPSDVSVDDGDPASFSVTATGASLSYQWQQSTDGGSSWANVGTDSNTYLIGSVTGSMNGYQYRCVVSGSCSPSATSTAATLTVSSFLYAFTSHTFTNCGASGRYGPTLSQCRSSYSPAWTDNDDFFYVNPQGIQLWTAPESGTYRITAVGASGGGSGTPGRGASMRGDFTLSRGDTVKILVGQQGSAYGSSSGGAGGGSFVTTYSNSPLVIAGGGAGAANGWTSEGGRTSTSGGGISPGTGGNGAGTGGGSGGGGGLNSNGANGTYGTGGASFVSGGAGGSLSGGFGGGGGNNNGGANIAGGGGGYSGGSGNTVAVNDCGGGGSYNGGSNQSNTANTNSGHGSVTILKL